MSNLSRSKNAKRNIIFGYIAQLGTAVLSFLGRKIFLSFLSVDYLGISGLYSNILTVMSLAELGVEVAVIYSLYKPVADNNTKLIYSMITYFRKIYWFLSIVILSIGIILIPFLKYIINSDISQSDLIIYYVFFLVNTISSYWVADKVALLSAFQEHRVQKIVTLIYNFVLQIVYIAVLVVFRNYYACTITMVVSTFIYNIVLSIITKRMHSEIFKVRETVPFDKSQIISRIKNTLLYKFGGVLINSTDNILISTIVGTAAVGFYANYLSIVSSITGFVSIITTSLIAGIGNLGVKEGKEKQKELFFMMVFFYHLIGALGLIGFSLLFQNLISVWLGEEYILDNMTVLIIAANFYLLNATSPIWMFREANGLFSEVKYLLLIRAAINIILSVALGYLWGVFGILLATTISMLLTNFWFEPILIFKKIFNCSVWSYWIKQIKYSAITLMCYVACRYLVSIMGNSIVFLVVKALLIVLFTSAVFYALNFKTAEVNKLKSYLLSR